MLYYFQLLAQIKINIKPFESIAVRIHEQIHCTARTSRNENLKILCHI